MLKVNNLVKKYNNLIAVNKISFEINKGEIVGLLGPNGAGKSSTMKSIIGLLNIDKGEILINNHINTSIDAKKSFAYVPEFPKLYDKLTVNEHIEFFAKAYKLKNYEKHANNLLKRYNMLEKKDSLAKELSKGMKQKVSIICNLLIDADLYLFDEPMIGLDPQAIKETKKIFLELKEKNKAIFISTHLLDSIEKICSKILVMKNGKIIKEGSLSELKGNQDISLEDLFLEVTN